MTEQWTEETTSSEFLTAAGLAASFASLSASTGTTEFGLTGSYSRVTKIISSDVLVEAVLDTHAPLSPRDLRAGDEMASRLYRLVHCLLLDRSAYGAGDTDIGSWNESVRAVESSGSSRRHYIASALIERLSLADTSGMQSYLSQTADIVAPYAVPVVSSGFLFAEIDRWLRDRRSDAQVELSAKALNRVEVENWLRSLESEGDKGLADRLALLLSVSDEDDEEDIPLTDEAILGFMDFLADVQFDGIRRSLTSAHGWLCTEWTYEDGRSLVLWFKNRVDTMVTAFGSDGKLIRHLGRDPAAGGRLGATTLLVAENFFS